ncbi:MAG: FAD-binding protein [Ilumatobacteraceae bacterium]|nr:FAD-binding protein [Ilumatobacteraceae bacterium]
MSRSRGLMSGVVRFEPDELVVTVGAGTSMNELAAVLGSQRQRLRIPTIGTVGGVLATRRNGPFPSDNSALPNIVLQIKAVDGIGREFVAGGGTVKNVSGFDLVKLLVGSWGTLATITEAILRTEPVPPCSRWFLGEGDVRSLYRPALVARSRDGLCVNLEGHPEDVAQQAGQLIGFNEIGPPTAEELTGLFAIASTPPRYGGLTPALLAVCRRLKTEFDPENTLSPGLSTEWGLT